jgi:hypothetical protein
VHRRIRRLDPVAVHRHILIVGVAAATFARALVLYPILLDYVPHILELLERENEAIE